MADKAKVSGLIIPIILIFLSLSLAGGVFYLYKKEQSLNLGLQQKLSDMETKLGLSERKYEEAQKKISSLDIQLEDFQTEVDELEKRLAEETAAKEQTEKLMEELKEDIGQQKMLRIELEKRLSQSRNEVIKIQKQIKDIQSQKDDLEVKLKELEEKYQEGIELGKIVVTPPVASSAVSELVPETAQAKVEPAVEGKPVKKKAAKSKKKKTVKSKKKIVREVPVVEEAEKKEKEVKNISSDEKKGTILVVNKDYNYVVVNLGSSEGIRLGDLFSIYHKNKYIGDVKVAKVHDSLSAADFVVPEIKNKINEGDEAVKKTE